MTREQAASMMEISAKLSTIVTPLFLALLAWNASQLVARIEKIEDMLTTVRIAQDRCETSVTTLRERFNNHVRTE